MTHRWITLLSATIALAAPRLIADPPARVGRLNLIQGTVSFRPASVEEWAIAQPNRPLTTGDRLWTDDNSKAEVHIGSTAIRLAAQTEFDFVNVDDQTMQARLAQGTATLRIRSLEDGQVYEVDTPNSAITFGRPGEYRIDVNSDGTQSVLSVWQGGAEVTAAGSSFEVNPHQVASINGTDTPTYDLADQGAPDAFDEWSQARDHREDASVSVRYVSREMPGYEDLDEYGHWTYVENYGNVWVPDHVGPGWAPYHTGHWVWVDPWGWTWVDDAPWGYAPYHYGRWAYVGAEWVWCPHPVPGPGVVVVQRPVYAPALVAFVGGHGWSVGVGGGGSVGWVPLAPYEVYHPPYTVSETYVRQVNVVNNTTIINNNTTIINNNTTIVNNRTTVVNGPVGYRNAGAPGAVTAVSTTAMASGQPVARSSVAVTPEEFRKAPPSVMGAGPAGVVPQRSAVIGGVATPAHAPPAAIENRTVVARTAPPPAAVPFEQQQKAIAANGGRPLGVEQQNQIRQTMPVASRPAPTLVRPVSMNTTNGSGLRPARAGLPAIQEVKAPATTGGFMQAPPRAPATPTTPAASNVVATPPSSTTPRPNVPQPTRVPQPGVAAPPSTVNTPPRVNAPPTATRVPQPGDAPKVESQANSGPPNNGGQVNNGGQPSNGGQVNNGGQPNNGGNPPHKAKRPPKPKNPPPPKPEEHHEGEKPR